MHSYNEVPQSKKVQIVLLIQQRKNDVFSENND